MRKFKTQGKNLEIVVESKEINIPENFAKEIAKSIEDEIDFEELIDLKGSEIQNIGSSRFSVKLETLMDMAYTDVRYEERNRKKLGFFGLKKPTISGSIPKNPTEKVFQTFKVNVSRESKSIMKSLKNKTLKYNSRIGSVNPKKIEQIEIGKESEKVHPLPEKPYVKDEKVFNPYETLFWSSQWESKPKKRKSLSDKVEVFKSIDDYNRSTDRRIGKPIL